MHKAKIPGLYWDRESGNGSIDKRLSGYGRIRERFKAQSWAEAEARYHQIVARAQSSSENEPGCRTFREAATKFLNEETKRSIARDAECLSHLDSWIGSLKIDGVHQGSLQPYIQFRKNNGVRSSTVQRELAVVRRILTLASRVWRDEDDKPWLTTPPLIRMPEWNDAAKPYPLSFEEQHRFFGLMPPHLVPMAIFGVNTGSRESIITGLRWEWEVKLPEQGCTVFLVPAYMTKNGTDQLIVLNKAARRAIESQRGINKEWVFTHLGKRILRINNNGWRTAWKKAGLPTDGQFLQGPHNLRHTFARRLRIAGVPLETRKVLLHHMDGDVTIHYSPAEIGELIEAVEKLGESQQRTMLRVVG